MTQAPICPPDTLRPRANVLDLSKIPGAAEAAQLDPVGWHYLQVLAERTRSQSGPAQALLHNKLHTALAQLQARLQGKLPAQPHKTVPPSTRPASPLSVLLKDMTAPSAERPLNPTGQGRIDNPRTAQFRQQLSKIRVQKQVSQAIAQAPQNAGPINSHMLVLRSLGLMRDLSPDYLNRFMGYVDCLLFLDSPAAVKSTPKKAVPAGKSER